MLFYQDLTFSGLCFGGWSFGGVTAASEDSESGVLARKKLKICLEFSLKIITSYLELFFTGNAGAKYKFPRVILTQIFYLLTLKWRVNLPVLEIFIQRNKRVTISALANL